MVKNRQAECAFSKRAFTRQIQSTLRRHKTSLLTSIAFATLTAFNVPISAEDITQSGRDLYGEVGMLDMPSARMAPDGQLALQLSGMTQDQRVTLAFQALPWLEGMFRYTRIPDYHGQLDYDRSFGLKARLFQETDFTPDISLGVRDILGTGLYSAEYLVATKRVYDVEVTAGLGWGRLAQNETFTNPFGTLLNSFKIRTPYTGEGGTIGFSQFFHGPDMGLFGGLNWSTPIDRLSVLAEYSSDRYEEEKAAGGKGSRSPVNIGLEYGPFGGFRASVGWLYGDTIGASLTVTLDPTISQTQEKIGPAPIQAVIRSDKEQELATKIFVEGSTSNEPTRLSGLNSFSPAISRQIKHTEFDHSTLLAEVHAQGAAEFYCNRIAETATNSPFLVQTVAVSDLDNPDKNIIICGVPQKSSILAVSSTKQPFNSTGPASAAVVSSEIGTLSNNPEIDEDGEYNPSEESVEKKLRDDAAAQSLRIESLKLESSTLTVCYENTRYEFESTALGRLVRLLMADAPPNVEEFRLVPLIFDVPTQEVRVLRGPMERMVSNLGTIAEVPQTLSARPAPMEIPALDADIIGTYPRFGWAVSPAMRESFFDPSSPIRIQIYGSFSASAELSPGISIQGGFDANIYDTFTTATLPESSLPHVRTDVAKYFTKGKNGFSNLDAQWLARVAPDVFVKAKAGYLENMYVGVGGEALWRPEGTDWVLGGDIYEVWKRNFDRLFGWQGYHVLTGHVTAYYRSPWSGLNFAIHMGRYLAGDYGATIEMSREFQTGVEVGTYATFTNVPFSKFGEGSFDKGLFIRIPFEWGLPFSTQSEYEFGFSPLTRDGGQRLQNDDSLYNQTRRTSYAEIASHIDEIGNP